MAKLGEPLVSFLHTRPYFPVLFPASRSNHSEAITDLMIGRGRVEVPVRGRADSVTKRHEAFKAANTAIGLHARDALMYLELHQSMNSIGR